MDLNEFVRLVLQEDVGPGDYTTLATVPRSTQGKSVLLVKEKGVLAGMRVAQEIVHMYDPELEFDAMLNDGDTIEKGQKAFYLKGSAASMLTIERTLLNVMQRMSGIATKTRSIVSTIESTQAKLLDTRKTTPLMRFLEKEAVRIGGGYNHRFGLYDMIMIKDNHVDFAGGIKEAIQKTTAYLKKHKLDLKIEIEVRSMDELEQVLEVGGVHRIMLDNFSPERLEKAVIRINRQYETEASGGITEDNVLEYALTGVDFISSGALTHSVKSLDLSLKAL
ncbi:MAG: carboxylating nicotinate-nucleotide diphosphorylase [Flavobacteriales bacterium]|nr:carboxylating nicotinate-nucleotide diphosphorylase [Flavobacteriales bacterium]